MWFKIQPVLWQAREASTTPVTSNCEHVACWLAGTTPPTSIDHTVLATLLVTALFNRAT